MIFQFALLSMQEVHFVVLTLGSFWHVVSEGRWFSDYYGSFSSKYAQVSVSWIECKRFYLRNIWCLQSSAKSEWIHFSGNWFTQADCVFVCVCVCRAERILSVSFNNRDNNCLRAHAVRFIGIQCFNDKTFWHIVNICSKVILGDRNAYSSLAVSTYLFLTHSSTSMKSYMSDCLSVFSVPSLDLTP